MEELGDAEEEVCGFLAGELLSSKEEKPDLREEYATFSGRYGRGIEDPRCFKGQKGMIAVQAETRSNLLGRQRSCQS